MESSRTLPKLKTQQKWKENNKYLTFSKDKMWCSLCAKYEDEIKSCKNFNPMFITGSNNFRLSTVKCHTGSEMHEKSLLIRDKEEAEKAGKKYIKTITPTGPTAIGKSLQNTNKLQEKDRDYLKRLFEVSYFIAMKGRPYSDFEDMLKLEKLHGVKFSETNAYEHNNACKTFIAFCSKSVFEKSVKAKLLRANFVSVLCDGSTDSSVIEKECVYVIFLDPDSFTPLCSFLSLQDPKSQDSSGIKEAIEKAFLDNGLETILDRMVFLSADGASVNAGGNTGLIVLLRQRCPWLVFVWCLSHRLELAMKHALKDLIEPIEKCLMNLYYLYEKSSKKTREIKDLYDMLKEILEFQNGVVKPHRAAGTRWIAHKLSALDNMLDKFGLYLSHLENIIADTSKKTDKATLEGKRRQLVSANIVLLGSVFFDLLEPARQFSLFSQKDNITLNEVTEVLEGTRKQYEQLLKKFTEEPDSVFKLPRLAQTLEKIEQCPLFKFHKFQGIKLTNFTQHRASLPSKSVQICEKLVATLNQYFQEFKEPEVAIENESLLNVPGANDKTDDKLLFHIAKVMTTSAWATEECISNLVSSMKFIYHHFSAHPILKPLNEMTLETEFVQLVEHAKNYHTVAKVRPLELWKVLFSSMKTTGRFDNIFLLVELCLVAPYANAKVERFFNYLKIIKTDWRSSLGATSLEHLLRIRVEGPDLQNFSENFCADAISLWWSAKQRRLQQGKRCYPKRKVETSKRQKFDNEFLRDFLTNYNDDDEEESEDYQQ